MKTLAFAVVMLVAGCHKAPPAQQPTSTTTSSETTTPTSTTASAKLGDKCGDNDACAAPATCVTYSGIAGPSGPQFKTCEVKCTPDTKCPDGTKCTTIADGPGSVCR